MKRTCTSILAGILAATMLLSGCSGNGGSSSGGGNTAQPGANASAEGASARTDLNMVMTTDLNTLDPHNSNAIFESKVIRNLFDALVEVDDETKEIVPALAESWEIAPDGESVTFKLRSGVKFHNGEDLKASDVKFSFERALEAPKVRSYSFAMKSMDVVDDSTVKLNLNYPYGSILSMVAKIYIVSEKAVTDLGDEFSRKPVGTGAYSLVEWEPAQQIVLKANDGYFNGAPALKDVVIKLIVDSNTAFIALETGDVDFYPEAVPVDVEQAKTNDKLTVLEDVANSFYFITFNNKTISDEKVRQAISYAVDVNTMNTIGFEGKGTLAQMPLKPGAEGYTEDVKVYDYNPDEAKKLLSEAGYSEGQLSLRLVFIESSTNKKMSQVMQEELANVGINLVLEPLESGTYYTQIATGDYDMLISGQGYDPTNTDRTFFRLFHTEGDYNYCKYSNPKVDELLNTARVESDRAKRDEIYKEVIGIVRDEAVYLPLYYKAATLVYDKNLQGVKIKDDSMYDFADFHW